jgi:hypothetical protein
LPDSTVPDASLPNPCVEALFRCFLPDGSPELELGMMFVVDGELRLERNDLVKKGKTVQIFTYWHISNKMQVVMAPIKFHEL